MLVDTTDGYVLQKYQTNVLIYAILVSANRASASAVPPTFARRQPIDGSGVPRCPYHACKILSAMERLVKRCCTMSPASFWDRSYVAPKQLPALQELIRCCDETLLMRVILDDHAARMEDEPPTPQRRRAMEKRLASTLRSMRVLPMKKKTGRDFLLMPEESFVLHAGSLDIERRLGASLVLFDDLRLLACSNEEAAARGEDFTRRSSDAPIRSFLGNRPLHVKRGLEDLGAAANAIS